MLPRFGGSCDLLVNWVQGCQESVPPEGQGGSLGVEHPLLEEREAGTAVHAALEQFEFRDLPFGLALRMSGQLYPMT